ncbi:MAG: molybdate ABC transporter substrate-binding protein [Vulcanimicrobiaceae bacterium]
MFRNLRRTAALAALASTVLTVAPAPARANTIVYALVAANATQPFNDLIAAFEKMHPGTTIKASYTGTQILEQQLESGAPCDIFLSADLPHATKLHEERLTGRFRVISRVHEVVVTPKDDPLKIDSLRDVAKPNTKLVIGVPDVPIGIYTRRIFKNGDRAFGDDFEKKALANVVSFEVNVKAVLQKVVLNEADAGIVYSTDVDEAARKAVRVIEIPAKLNVRGSNYIAVATKAASGALARDFVTFALSPAGQKAFFDHGYDRR